MRPTIRPIEGFGSQLAVLRRDVALGARMLLKHRGLTLVALASLAIGIGANAAVFSLVDAILLRPRAVAEPTRLVEIYSGHSEVPFQTSSYPSYLDFRARNDVFTGLAAYGVGWQFRLGGAGEVEPVWGEVVSGNYFDVLGIRMHLGRGFAPDEDEVAGRNPVVVLSHGLWQRRFLGDAGIVGRAVVLEGVPLTVVGVAAPSWNGMTGGWASEVFVPAMSLPALDSARGLSRIASRDSKWVVMVGRLGPGVTLEAARAQFRVLTETIAAEHPEEWSELRDDSVREYFVSLLPERDTRVHPSMRLPIVGAAAALFVVVNLLLVMACMNLASLQLASALARRGEIAVRLALGAGRARLVRQLLTESVVVSIAAGAAGVAGALLMLEALFVMLPPLPEGIRLALDLHVDERVIAYSLFFAVSTGVLFGLAPALHASRSSVSGVLRDEAAGLAGHIGPARVRQILIGAQVALSVLLLAGAGLLWRSLDNVRATNLGYGSDRVLVAPLELGDEYDRVAAHQFFERLSESVEALPGVRAASLVEGIPGGFLGRSRRALEVDPTRPGERIAVDAAIVGPGHFSSLGVPLVAGRDLDARDRDGAPCVLLVNEVFAQRFLGGVSAGVGAKVRTYTGRDAERGEACEVVGVLGDEAWHSLEREVPPFFAVPLYQTGQRSMTLLVYTAGEPSAAAAGVRAAIRALDPLLVVSGVQTLGATLKAMAMPFRLIGALLGLCGILAMLLATLGVYGTMAHAVVRRRHEVGIRMALGAVDIDVVRLVVGHGMRVVAVGLASGLALGLAAAHGLGRLQLDVPFLLGVEAWDPATFVAVVLGLGSVALVACVVPALRASRADPARTLRGA
jgi:predicted permease